MTPNHLRRWQAGAVAMISNFNRIQSDVKRRHAEIECLWFNFVDEQGEPVLQLRTDGSATRQRPGKASQTLQLDRESAEELIGILRSTFPGIGSP